MFGGETKHLVRLADRLGAVYESWDARVMSFDGTRALVLDVYPGRMSSVFMIRQGQWWSLSFFLDDDGAPVPPSGPPTPIGVKARDVDAAAEHVIRTLVSTYRAAVHMDSAGESADAVRALRPMARTALQRLTNERFDDEAEAAPTDHSARLSLVEAWAATPTWQESFDFLTEHWDQLHDPAVMHSLQIFPGEVAAQHRAILALSKAWPLGDLFSMVTSTRAAAEAVLAALQRPSTELAQVLVAANPFVVDPDGEEGLTEAPSGARAALAALMQLATGDSDGATRSLSAYAATASAAGRGDCLALLTRYTNGADARGAADAWPLIAALASHDSRR